MIHILNYNGFLNEMVYVFDSNLGKDIKYPDVAEMWGKAQNYILKNHSYLSQLVLALPLVETERIDIGATDANYIYYNPVWIKKNAFSFSKITYLYLHELYHVFLNHCSKARTADLKLKYNGNQLNIVFDIAIDNILNKLDSNITVFEPILLSNNFEYVTSNDFLALLYDKDENKVRSIIRDYANLNKKNISEEAIFKLRKNKTN